MAPRAAIFLGVFSVVFGPAIPKTTADRPPESPDAAYSRLYFALQSPADRDTERSVALIEELLEADRFGEAAPLIDRVFASPSDFVDSSGVSLKKRLLAAVNQAESRGVSVVRSVLSGVYRRKLSEARSIDRLRDLVAQYQPELFGVEALVALARQEEARGAYATAARLWREAGQIAHKAGHHDGVDEYRKAAEANAMRGGLVPASDDPRLQAAVAAAEQNRAPASWLGPGGDARRVNQAAGRPPIAWRAWRAPIEPAVPADHLSSEQGGATGGTVAVGGLLLAPTTTGLVALSAESGKRLWETRSTDTASANHEPRYDRLRGSVATDGKLAFVVEPVESPVDSFNEMKSNRLFMNRQSLGLPPNTLAAYSVARRGKLVWRFEDNTAGGEPISPSFLGPPAVAESRLYAIAEIDQAVCLVSLDAATGRLEWVQPIVRCEQRFPAHAERIGITPTVADGRIYCPTGRGAVAAIDPLRRQIEWIHYLQVDRSKARPNKRPGWRGFGRVSWDEEPAAWRHCRVIESGDRVAVVSPALASLEVLDAGTGETVWTRELDTGLYLAGVDTQTVTTVGLRSVVSHDLSSGDELWSVDLPAGENPSGEPLKLEAGLLLPLDSGRFVLVRSDGTIESIDPNRNPLELAPKLGDLIYHRGAIYSRSGESIECFQQTVPDTLAGEALRVLTDGGERESLERLLNELRERPDDKEAAELIAVNLLQQAMTEGSDAEWFGQQISRLIAGPRGRAYATLLRIDSATDQATAENLLNRLRNSASAGEVISREPGHWATAERLATARLGSRFPIEATANASRPEPPIDRTPWSLNQIEATIDIPEPTASPANFNSSRRNRRRRQPTGRSRPLSFGTISGPAPRHQWRVESEDNETALLVGSNRWGERLISTPITSAWTNRSRNNGPAVGLPADCYWDGWIGLRLENGFAVYRVEESDEACKTELAWESTSASGLGFPTSINGSAAEHLFAIGPWGTISIAGNEVLCRDLSTGDLQWQRQVSFTGSERIRLLIDRQTVLVAGRSERGTRLSVVSGELVESDASIAPARLWRAYAPAESPHEPARLLVEERTITGREYRLHPLDDFESPIWRAEAQATALATVTPDGLLALLSKQQQLTLVDLRRGTERFSITLPLSGEPPIRAIRVREHAGSLLVEIDRTNPMIDRHRGLAGIGNHPLLTGELYCLDPQSGELLWAGPAEVSAMCVLPSPVRDAPVLLLARSQRDPQNKETLPKLSLVALDLATGGTRYSNHDIPARDARHPTRFWMKAESPGVETLTIRLGGAWVILRPTDRPTMPRPPMLARVEDPIASKPKGTKDVGESVQGLFKSIFQD